MNAFSKTHAPCDCGWLSQAINDPLSGIHYHTEDNSISLSNGGAIYPLYHCPFCGGAFPESSHPLSVPIVPQHEFDRLKALIEPLKDAESIVSNLGKPDYDAMTANYISQNGRLIRDTSQDEGRNIEYWNLSEWLNVEFWIYAGKAPYHRLAIKSLSPRHVDGAEPCAHANRPKQAVRD